MSDASKDLMVPTPQGHLWVRIVTPRRASGRPLLVAHGGPGFPSHYLEPLSALADERVVVFYDQIGAGRSEGPADSTAWSVDGYVDRLELVRHHLGMERIHLFGHSWAGFLSLSYWERYPDRVETMILGSPLVDSDIWMRDAADLIAELPKEYRESIRSGAESPGFVEAEMEFSRRHFCRVTPWPEPLQRAADSRDARSYEAMWGPNEFTNTGSLRGMSRAHLVPMLDIPNLWMCGTDDEARPVTLREFARQNANSRVVEIPGTHNVHLERPQEYIEEVRDFLHSAEGSSLS